MLTEPEPVAIFVPSMDRPHKLEALVANIHEVTLLPHKIYFVVGDYDVASQKILDCLGESYWTDSGDLRFCTRIQFLYENTEEPWFLTGADDVLFHAEWLERAFARIEPHHCVVTFNDLNNPFGTNFMIRRKYIKEVGGVIDMPPGIIYYPEYKHNFSDNELIETASVRNAFLKVEDSVIEHLHWVAGKSEYDETYQYASDMWDHDEQIFWSRRHLWTNQSTAPTRI